MNALKRGSFETDEAISGRGRDRSSVVAYSPGFGWVTAVCMVVPDAVMAGQGHSQNQDDREHGPMSKQTGQHLYRIDHARVCVEVAEALDSLKEPVFQGCVE